LKIRRHRQSCYLNFLTLQEEYKFAAMALDRLCLIVFILFLTVSISAILFSPPYLNA
jgi:hypothetical protein